MTNGAAVLNQDEVDALLNGMNVGTVSTESAAPPESVRQYDLGKEARIVRGRMPTLEMLNQRFARLYRNSLYDMLRRTAAISVSDVRTMKYGEYLLQLHVPTSLNMIRVAPLRGTGLLVLSPRFVFTVVDNYFGGKGRYAKIEGRDFTATESRIIRMLLDAAFTDMQEAWSNVFPISIEYLSSEMNPQFANIVSPTEIVVVVVFKIELEGGNGELHFTLPYAMIEPIRETLDSGLQSDRNDNDGRWMQSLREEIEDADVELTTRIASTSVSLEQLMKLKPGDVLPCDFSGRVTVYAEDVPIMRGTFGVSRGQQAVKVEERVHRARTQHNEAAPGRA